MRIGIDAHVLGKKKGGVERYVDYLVKLLPDVMAGHDFFIFVNSEYYHNEDLPDLENVTYVPMFSGNPIISRLFLLPYACKKYRLDVLQVQRIIPFVSFQAKVVLTLHDITPIKYPSLYPGFSNFLVRRLTRFSVSYADWIVTPTISVAEEVTSFYSLGDGHISPFYNGVDKKDFDGFSKEVSSDREHYIFFSGALEARKNLEVVIRALKSRSLLRLVVAGSTRDLAYRESLEALIQSLGLKERVSFEGFVSNERLLALYRDAFIFVAPSFDEGFNIPPLEAMAMNVPVLCSDIPVHKELFSKAALFFPPDDDLGLGELIDKLCNDHNERERLISSAREQCVEKYTWEMMVERMKDVYLAL